MASNILTRRQSSSVSALFDSRKVLPFSPVCISSSITGVAKRLKVLPLIILLLPGVSAAEITLSLGVPEYGVCGIVNVNGYVASDAGEITGMNWDWGDGNQSESWFLATHEYAVDGTYQINVTAHDSTGDAKTENVEATVQNAMAPGCEFGIRIHPDTIYLRDGKTSEQLKLEIRDASNRPTDPGSLQFEMASSDPSLVQVSADGLVTSTAYGQARITVTLLESGRQAFVDVFAGHLRTRPIFQYLSVEGQSTGSVEVDIGNADGSPVNLAEHTLEYLCLAGCAPGEPLELDFDGSIQVVEDFEEGDPAPLAIIAVVDGRWAQNVAVVHVSQQDLGLELIQYETPNNILATPDHMGDFDYDSIISSMSAPVLLEQAFQAQKILTDGVWGGGGKQAWVHYVSRDRLDGRLPGCGGSGNPIRTGSILDRPDLSCFVLEFSNGVISPRWGILFHELGHNFTWTALLFGQFAGAGGDFGFSYSEGLATAAAMFSCEYILRSGVSEVIAQTLKESWLCWQHDAAGNALANYVANGSDYTTINPDIVDDIIWTLIQEHDFGILYRFFSLFSPRTSFGFPFVIGSAEAQATLFALAFSEATKTDLKARFRDDWGFPIDAAIWNAMAPFVTEAIRQRDPASFAGADRTIDLGDTITMADAYVYDPLDDETTVSWQIVDQPLGANGHFGDSGLLHTTFTADREGVYTLGLTAANSWVTGEQDMVLVSVVDPDVIFKNGFE